MIKHFTRNKALKCTVSHPYYIRCEFQTYSRFPSLTIIESLPPTIRVVAFHTFPTIRKYTF